MLCDETASYWEISRSVPQRLRGVEKSTLGVALVKPSQHHAERFLEPYEDSKSDFAIHAACFTARPGLIAGPHSDMPATELVAPMPPSAPADHLACSEKPSASWRQRVGLAACGAALVFLASIHGRPAAFRSAARPAAPGALMPTTAGHVRRNGDRTARAGVENVINRRASAPRRRSAGEGVRSLKLQGNTRARADRTTSFLLAPPSLWPGVSAGGWCVKALIVP
ncbi:hypothetical protein EMIHUDRAFT_241906 [Emiliania huxleyi CCMP1516]|uniref:Uncharacterized protein n=2 Tax=Emiliania huxleyi TaxID=2903 RepID=A0A0D3JB12_EMIH1|nr:hypothetical protein EMIHUDRAFT_241906 [Emiliania huxleyi CCMP1516]EOD20697.1 hypothetical protein EMIHUDRAFT_241906 [Emiliania huxleyi CCMP1516]|eukprot:XP_005773126.1 hypothetical protein EMIHUDRAFT_241906 [Emiliania huxleyi CCMP1516]